MSEQNNTAKQITNLRQTITLIMLPILITLVSGVFIYQQYINPKKHIPSISNNIQAKPITAKDDQFVLSINTKLKIDVMSYYSKKQMDAFWSIAQNKIPKFFNTNILSKEDKVNIMLSVLHIGNFLTTKPVLVTKKDVENTYNICLNEFESKVTSWLPDLNTVPRISKIDAKKLRKTVHVFDYTVHSMIVKDEVLAKQLANTLKNTPVNIRFAEFKKLLDIHSIGLNKKEHGKLKQTNINTMPSFYLPVLEKLTINNVETCRDTKNKTSHIIFLKDKKEQDLSFYMKVDTLEYILPVITIVKERPGEGTDEAAQYANQQNMIDLSNQKNLNPLTDKEHTWVRRSFNVFNLPKISVVIKGGYIFLATTNQIKALKDLLFFATNLKVNKLLQPQGEQNPVTKEIKMRLVYITGITKVFDPNYIKDFLINNLLIDDSAFQKKLSDSVKFIVDSNVYFYKSKQNFIDSLEN